jgi:hypothetical protein
MGANSDEAVPRLVGRYEDASADKSSEQLSLKSGSESRLTSSRGGRGPTGNDSSELRVALRGGNAMGPKAFETLLAVSLSCTSSVGDGNRGRVGSGTACPVLLRGVKEVLGTGTRFFPVDAGAVLRLHTLRLLGESCAFQ